MSKERFLALVIFSMTAFTADLLADEKAIAAAEYRENYRFSLSYLSSAGESTSIEFVVSAQSFEISTIDPKLNFSGQVITTEGNDIVLQYKLRIERQIVSGQIVNSEGVNPFQTITRDQGGLNSNVRLRLGSPIKIMSVGKEEAKLMVSKVKM